MLRGDSEVVAAGEELILERRCKMGLGAWGYGVCSKP